MLCA
ncbi:hypothetical protein ECEC4402_0497, partial [Escherichia coli EC4402]